MAERPQSEIWLGVLSKRLLDLIRLAHLRSGLAEASALAW
jgi:hypothetical protein